MQTTMTQQPDEFILQFQKNSDEVRRIFGGLSAQQLNWKPQPEKWSVGQCLDHLIVINTSYFPILEHIIAGEKKATFWERIRPISRFFGKLLIKAMKGSGRVKAPAAFAPSSSAISPEIVDTFITHHHSLIQLIEQLSGIDLQNTIITSPASRLVHYSVYDGLTILILHEHRHIAQAKKVMESEHFPKG